jgi:hypothetical protein
MSLNLDVFMENVEKLSVPDKEVKSTEIQMEIIMMVAYSYHKRVGDIDFSSFSCDDAIQALDEINAYYPDEGLDGEDGMCNRSNLLTELNRIPHFQNIVDGLKVEKHKKKFF